MSNLSTALPIRLLLTGLLMFFAGCTGEEGGKVASDASWAALRRPLLIEPLARAPRCPVTTARVLSPRFGRGQGTGPVYPVGAARGLQFVCPVEPTQGWYPSEWSGNKVAWVARKGFAGRVLIRGWRRDGSDAVRFGDKPQPQTELRLTFSAKDRGEGGWLNKGTYTRIRAPGCYAWQLDGRDFTHVITFRAIRIP